MEPFKTATGNCVCQTWTATGNCAVCQTCTAKWQGLCGVVFLAGWWPIPDLQLQGPDHQTVGHEMLLQWKCSASNQKTRCCSTLGLQVATGAFQAYVTVTATISNTSFPRGLINAVSTTLHFTQTPPVIECWFSPVWVGTQRTAPDQSRGIGRLMIQESVQQVPLVEWVWVVRCHQCLGCVR